jgi:hypothetical protein
MGRVVTTELPRLEDYASRLLIVIKFSLSFNRLHHPSFSPFPSITLHILDNPGPKRTHYFLRIRPSDAE